MITFVKCLIMWTSKLQNKIAFSTTKAEYNVLSSSLKQAIPLMDLIDELSKKYD